MVESVDERHARKVLARAAMELLDRQASDKLRVGDDTPLQDEVLSLEGSPLEGAARTVPLARRLTRTSDTLPFWEPAARLPVAAAQAEASQSSGASDDGTPPPSILHESEADSGAADCQSSESEKGKSSRSAAKKARRGRSKAVATV